MSVDFKPLELCTSKTCFTILWTFLKLNLDHLYNFHFHSVVQFNDNQVTSDLLNTKESILSVCDKLVA